MKQIKKRAEEKFVKRNYLEAMRLFSYALTMNPEDKEARVGVLLADMATDYEEEAQALHDYYQIIKSDAQEQAEEMLEQFISGFDGGVDQLSELISGTTGDQLQYADGILYHDFTQLVHDRGGFKRAFEDLMHSTRIIISGKEDFFDFMEKLVDHGFSEIALKYIESANNSFSHDQRIRTLMDKIHKTAPLEDSSSK